jgi:hypothetical protein
MGRSWRRCPRPLGRYPRSHRARGKPKRRRSTRTIPILVRQARLCFSNNAPEASYDRRQPQSPSDYRQSSERGRARACVLCPKTARERVCFAQKPIAATKMAMWATQQPQRGGTTSCASRPSAGIDRAKCLISLKATGEQGTILCTVRAAIPLGRPDPEGEWHMEHEPRRGAPSP